MKLLTINQIKNGSFIGQSLLTPIIMNIPNVLFLIGFSICIINNFSLNKMGILFLCYIILHLICIPIALYLGICETYIDEE